MDRLLSEGHAVVDVDNFDPFYDPAIKRQRAERHQLAGDYTLIEADIADPFLIERLRTAAPFDAVLHMAARAGIRPSIQDPVGYTRTNVTGTQNLLEAARKLEVGQFVFASSSSVYGLNPRVPWREDDPGIEPISPYAATKLSCEHLGRVYSRLYGIRFVALRFFTVYGPGQRPDLAITKFARCILNGEELPFFGDGSTRRDYTFIADTVAGVRAALDYTGNPFEIINLGNNKTVSLAELIEALETALGRSARLKRLPEQPGDVPQTWASVDKAARLLGYQPSTSLPEGLRASLDWFREVASTGQLST